MKILKKSKKETKKTLSEAYSEFNTKILGEYLDDNFKAFWSCVRKVQGNSAIVYSLINERGDSVTDDRDKANVLNIFFRSVFSNFTTNISTPLPRLYQEQMPLYLYFKQWFRKTTQLY